MMFWKLISATAALVLSTSVYASLIDNGTYTTDTTSGLDWLDLTETTGLSYSYVSSQLGVGGQFEGWSYASYTDVRVLLNNEGGSGTYNGSWSTENNGIVIPILDLWGHTQAYGDSTAITNDPFFLVPSRRNLVRLNDRPSYSESLTMDNINLGAGGVEDTWVYSTIGSALIRPSVVPVPAAVWLFGSGLIGLVGFARRKKA